MICPHCSTAVNYKFDSTYPQIIDEKKKIGTEISYATCQNCNKFIIYILTGLIKKSQFNEYFVYEVQSKSLIYPKEYKSFNPDEIPKMYLEDYEEAMKVITISPKASAALSRRVLQKILRESYTICENSLSQEIDKFINLSGIPSYITDAVDAIRIIGNLAAHPIKDKNTGEIVSVELGEAEWLIEVVEALFEFTFIQPNKLEKRRNALNLKLENIGKPKP
jgi:hypothetical protein